MDDITLIKACQNGNKQAFNDLIRLYYPYVSKFLLKLTADEILSDDLTQETFIKMIRNIDRFDTTKEGTFATYLITIAKRLYIDYLRKNKYEFLNIEKQEIIDNHSFEKKFLNQLTLNDVMKMIDKLPPQQAEAIKLKYLEEMTLQEIAEKLKTQPKTIKSRIHSGVVKLRSILKKGGHEYD